MISGKVIFIGDSITDCGRAQPVGEGLFGALGQGYVALMEAWVTASRPDLTIRWVNMGTSGNTVRDLEARWQRDVLDLNPDLVLVMIGANDVWRQFDSPTRPEQGVPLAEYEETLHRLVKATVPTKIQLVSPFFLEPLTEDRMRARMDEYGAAMARVAGKHEVPFIDVQSAFEGILDARYSAEIGWDRVHPTQAGHMVVARTILAAWGLL
jgi:lysophospholipase L1-like esterase